MKKLIIMVGLPKSGKSTYVDQNYNDMQILCPDDIRLGMGVQFDERLEPFVWCVHNSMIRAHMERGRSIVLDSTNTLLSAIEKHIRIADEYNYEHDIIFITTPISTCIRRNIGEGSIPDAALLRMNDQLKVLRRDRKFKRMGVKYVKNDHLY